MFGFRTPAKGARLRHEGNQSSASSGPATEEPSPTFQECEMDQTANVRKSIGEWESGKVDSKILTTPKKAATAEPPKLSKPKKTLPMESRAGARRLSAEAAGSPPTEPKSKYINRLSEARACVTKAKLNLGNSRNIKTEIKAEVTQAIERLYQLVKEAESAKGQKRTQPEMGKEPEREKEPETEKEPEKERKIERELMRKMEEHANLIRENNEKMEKLKETMEKTQEAQDKLTYANVAAAHTRRQPPEQTALHSVVVTAKDDMETGEEILNRIREAMNAKEGGVAVERIRKAKDRKVIVGCRTEEERQQVKKRLMRAEEHLIIQDMKNKDPLVILKDVLQYNTDRDILGALWKQNRKVLQDLDEEEHKVEVAYKKRTRNLQTHHVVMRVSPKVWQRLVEAGTVLIDLQRVRVEDQSPLVQCSLCLGYGHGRRFCKETVEKCSHCGGPHMKAECADWLASAAPACCNCTHAKLDRVDHNAFSNDCAIRKKWETLARSTIAYHC